jgi:hypothetical protein
MSIPKIHENRTACRKAQHSKNSEARQTINERRASVPDILLEKRIGDIAVQGRRGFLLRA